MIALHLASALGALGLGAAVLFLRKGTTLHRALGGLWVALMLATALSSFGITRGGAFSWIHLLSVWTLVSLASAVYFIRRGNVQAHRGFMVGTYLGLLGAGAGALAPGRLLYGFFFA
jgi:uncharacterized membrane protein